MMWENKRIQLYRDAWDTQGIEITAGEFMLLPWHARPAVVEYIGKTPEQLRQLVREVRATDKSTDRERYSELKKRLPAAAFAGTFSKRSAAGIVTRSRLVVVDIDGQDNPDKTPEQLAAILGDVPEIVYCGLSVGGRGLWAIIQVSTDQHKQHCEQLIRDFAALGVNLDTACKDLPRLRCFTYDPDPAIFRREAPEFARWYIAPYQPPKVPQRSNIGQHDDICALLDKLIQTRTNICASYDEWLRVAAALHSLGTVGRNYFHALSAIDPRYNEAESEKKWNQAASLQRIGVGTVFELARNAGCLLYDEQRRAMQRSKDEARKNQRGRGYSLPAWLSAEAPKPKIKRPDELPEKLQAMNQAAGGGLSWLISTFECTAIDGGRKVQPDELLQYLGATPGRGTDAAQEPEQQGCSNLITKPPRLAAGA